MASNLSRSYLYAPGNRDDLLRKVFAAGADAVVLDLEDAVPSEQKEASRDRVRAALETAFGRELSGKRAPQAWVRINALDTECWQADVKAVVVSGLFGVRVPKCESVEGLDRLHRALLDAELEAGLEAGAIRITATLESAAGVLQAHALARHPRVDLFAFGSTDFMADIGADPEAESKATLWARSQLVAQSRAAGLAPPIAPVWTRLGDGDGLAQSTRECRQLGFFGRSCIHPSQVAVIHRVFTPTETELSSARRILAAWETARQSGGAVTVDETGRFVDPAVLRRARRILQLAEDLK